MLLVLRTEDRPSQGNRLPFRAADLPTKDHYLPDFIRQIMAKAKTSTFTITESIQLSASTGYASIPIGSLIDVGDAQALEIEAVDYSFMTYDTTNDVYRPLSQGLNITANSDIGVQLTDRNTTEAIDPADNNLISQAQLLREANGGLYEAADMYPDDFKNDTGRFVVNDELYLRVFGNISYQAGYELVVAVRVRAKVVKLSTRDWMAISLETVQNE